MIDSHVNLHHEKFAGEIDEIIMRAHDSGVSAMLTICDRIENLNQIKAICHANKNIWYSVGAHPHEAKDHLNLTAQQIIALCEDPLAIGIGEAGLDFHYDLSPRDQQIKVFEAHIEAAQEIGLPLIVHTRLADEIMGDILENSMKLKAFPLLMHCYTSSNELMRRMMDIGAYVSISGIATFKNAEDVRANILDIPNERLLIETDCPYLAPIPMRGRRNEPSFIRHVFDFVCGFKKMDAGDLDQILDRNFFELFKKAKMVPHD